MRAVSAARRRLGSAAPGMVAVAVVACYSGTLVWAMSTRPYDTWGAVVFGPVLLLVSVPLLRRATRDEPPEVFWVLLGALALKLVAAMVRYAVAAELYDGVADARSYAEEGERLAAAYRHGVLSADLGRGFVGTGAVRMLTGIVFAVTGRTSLGGNMVFSWWAFWGLVGFYKAFRTAIPDGDHRRYALLLFFLPSLLYWPSSIGKDAWMLLGLGVAAFGAARLIARQRPALPYLAAGLTATAIVRPHVTALVCAGLVAAYTLRRSPRTRPLIGPLAKPLGLMALLLIMAVIVQQAQTYFGVEDEPGTGATTVLDNTAEQTDDGGSSFEPLNARSVTDIPAAVVAVLFRPFPWEAHNAQALLSSLEGLVLLFLMVGAGRRLSRLPQLVRRRPYVVLVLVYVVLFCVAFSSFGNFGILTRQRVQLLPFALMLLAIPRTRVTRVIDVTDASPWGTGLTHLP